jgi:hypothetical protein
MEAGECMRRHSEVREPQDPNLWQLTTSAVLEGKTIVENLLEQQVYISEYYDFPKLSGFRNGFPNIYRVPFSKRPDYTQAFTLKKSSKDPRPAFEEIDSFRDVIDYVQGNPTLLAHFGPPTQGSPDREITVLGVGLFISGILNRSIYLHGLDSAADEAGLRSIYLEMERPIFNTELPVDFLVPVVLTRFDVDQAAELCPGMRIEKLTDGEHLARFTADMTGSAVNRFVIGAASHSLVVAERTASFRGLWDYAYQSLFLLSAR